MVVEMKDSGNVQPTAAATSLRDLPQETQPARDLWAGIEARLAQAPGAIAPITRPVNRTWIGLIALAASMAFVALGIGIGRGTHHAGAPATTAVSTPLPTFYEPVYITDAAYRRERAAQLKALPQQLAALPPEAQARVAASLAEIQSAMRSIERELGRDSGNVLLQEMLTSTCQDEMRVLAAINNAHELEERI
jgi:hypothetical protein